MVMRNKHAGHMVVANRLLKNAYVGVLTIVLPGHRFCRFFGNTLL